MQIRRHYSRLLFLGFMAFSTMTPGDLLARNSIEGGSGLLRIEDAWSLPVTGLLFGVYGGYYDNNFSPGTSRFISMTPSFTKGLGQGFEVSGAWPIEGLTSGLDGDRFGRRFDFRLRDPLIKARWTRFVGDPRLRAGVSGSLVLPIEDKTRPGGLEKPGNAFDYGVRGLFSADLGSLRAPVRLHINSGYWWSRDDRAFFYRGLPRALPLVVESNQVNDVFEFGIGLEAGFTRFNVFAELSTQQLWDARAEIKGGENYWRFTPGVRTELTSTIGLTAALSFDLSKDSDETTFDPSEVYPDVELQVGLTMGQVLDRVRRARRVASVDPSLSSAALAAPATQSPDEQIAPAPLVASTPTSGDVAASAGAAPPEKPVLQPVLETSRAATQPPIVEASAAAVVEQRMQDVLQRLSVVETTVRLGAIESRIAMLEGSTPAAAERQMQTRTPQTVPEQPSRTESTSAPGPEARGEAVPSQLEAPASATEALTTSSFSDSATSRLASEGLAQNQRLDALSANVDQLRAAVQALVEVQSPETGRSLTSPTATPQSIEKVATQSTSVDPAAAPTSGAAEIQAPGATPQPTQVSGSRESVMQAEIQRLQQQIAALSLQRADEAPQPSTSVVLPSPQTAVPWVQQSVVVPPAAVQQPESPNVSLPFEPSAGPGVSTTERLKLETQQEIENSRALRGGTPQADTQASDTGVVATGTLNDDAGQKAPLGDFTRASSSLDTRSRVASLEVGQKRTLAGIDASGIAEMATALRSTIDELALDLIAQPSARIMLLVYGGSTDRTEALKVSEAVATSIRKTLVESGAHPEQIVALGMGLSAIGTEVQGQSVEIQRLR